MKQKAKIKGSKTAKPVTSKTGISVLSKELTAKKFIDRLKTFQSDEELKKDPTLF